MVKSIKSCFLIFSIISFGSLFCMVEQQVIVQKRPSERKKLSSLNHLNNNLRLQGQQRRAATLSTHSGPINPVGDEVRIDINQLPKKDKKREVQRRDKRVMQPRSVEPMYTPNHIQEVLSATNPVLYNFGQKKQIPVDQLLEYAQLLQDYHLEPAAIVEFIKSHNELDKTKPKSWEVKQYEDIQKNDPEKYMEIALSVIKKIQDQSAGQQKTSVMNTTHVGILQDQVTGQQDTLYKGRIVFAVQTLLTIGTFAWGIYGQIVNSSASACLNGTHT